LANELKTNYMSFQTCWTTCRVKGANVWTVAPSRRRCGGETGPDITCATPADSTTRWTASTDL